MNVQPAPKKTTTPKARSAVKVPARDPIKIRKQIVREFGIDFPPTANVLLEWAIAQSRQNGLLSFSVADIPPTVNHLYNTIGDRWIMSKEGKRFKQAVAASIGGMKATWKPQGVVMVLIFLQSPHWVTKKNTIRDMDGDNRIKALLDAVQAHTGYPDYTNWELHVYKVASTKVRTTTYLFDLGDIVNWHA